MSARDFLNQIFKSDPEMRPSIDHMKKHRLFMQDKPADYWSQVLSKSYCEVPYKPSPLKNSHLLQNDYPIISNLHHPSSSSSTAANPASGPAQYQQRSSKSQSSVSLGAGACAGGAPTTNNSGCSTAMHQLTEPNANRNTTANTTSGNTTSGNTAAAGSMAVMSVKRPTNLERVQNVGLFGRGCGDFDAMGNVRQQQPPH